MILKSVNLAVVALIALSLIAAPVSAQTEAYHQALEEAETLVLERDYKSAIKAYKKAQKLAGEPTYECCYGLANAFINVGAYKNGVESVREALSLARDVGQELRAYNLLGIGLFAGGGADEARLEQAVEAFEKVLEITRGLSPGQQGATNLARYNLGVSLLKLGRDDEGIAVLNDFLAADPTCPEAETARAYVDNPLRARVALMPEFEVVTLDGEYLTSEELAGKVVLLDFWGTWCAPCVAAIPHLKRLSRRSEKSPFVLLSISNDSTSPCCGASSPNME